LKKERMIEYESEKRIDEAGTGDQELFLTLCLCSQSLPDHNRATEEENRRNPLRFRPG